MYTIYMCLHVKFFELLFFFFTRNVRRLQRGC